jgi:DNA modification methylase
VTLLQGDCREMMATLEAASIDSIVTDPPYGLSFMGKGWDHGVPGVEFWTEALRVAKFGAHLLAFGGTRTYHRLACAIEDAGWEIRDCVMWVYGSGFPKSHDVSKAIDKANGRKFEDRYALGRHIRERRQAVGLTQCDVNGWFGYRDGCQHWERQDASGARVPTVADFAILQERLELSDEWRKLVERVEAEREVTGAKTVPVKPGFAGEVYGGDSSRRVVNITAPATEAARQWSGWGTALKPAWEPIIVARKPLVGTVAENVLTHGTGAINVDGCRVEGVREKTHSDSRKAGNGWGASPSRALPPNRFPANLIHDGSGEVTAPMGEAARFFYCAKASKADRDEGCEGLPTIRVKMNNGNDAAGDPVSNRFTKMARNHHPTVKPTDLMRYLCRLVTPPNGIVLDPFCGSGSTGKAAILEGFRFVGIEREAEYVEIARARIAAAEVMQ